MTDKLGLLCVTIMCSITLCFADEETLTQKVKKEVGIATDIYPHSLTCVRVHHQLDKYTYLACEIEGRIEYTILRGPTND